jgi:spermidine/putrescine transport system ATP-binding protein
VLLLDEPLSALDLKLRRHLQLELRRLQQELGMAFLYVTHDQDEALTLSDAIVVMQDGRVEQQSSPRELYDRPASLFAATFVGDANVHSGVVRAVEPGRATVAIGTAMLAGSCRDDLPPGAEARFCLRPERIRVLPAGRAGGVEATVADVIFAGAVVRYWLRLTNAVDVQLVASVTLAPDEELLEPGRRVTLDWDPDAAFVFPA